MADLNILERLFGIISGNDIEQRTLDQRELLRREPVRRIGFDPTQGPNTGEAFDPSSIPVDISGGQLEELRKQQGLASDDPGQIAAKLNAYQRGLNRDQRRLREYLQR